MKNWPFALWGGDGSDDESGDDSREDSSEEEPTTITMSQKELESSIARAASRASRKATKELRESLGFSSQDELNAFVNSTREAQEAEKSEAEKAQAKLDEDRKALESQNSAVQNERIDLKVDRAIVMAGITDEAKVKRIRTLVRTELDEGNLDMDALEEEVATAIASVKSDVPSLFSTNAQNPGSGDGGANDDPPSEAKKAAERDKKLADEYARRGLISTPT
jgi:hypothetical protein